jgi:hypothetical protein
MRNGSGDIDVLLGDKGGDDENNTLFFFFLGKLFTLLKVIHCFMTFLCNFLLTTLNNFC